MKSKCAYLAMLVFLSLVLGRVAFAQELQPLEPDWLTQMYAEGWEKVQEGVLHRDTGGGEFETFAYGEQGLRWVIQGYQSQLGFFEAKHNALPTEELAAVIEQLTLKIDQLNEELVAAPSAESFDGAEMVACTGVSFGGQASADPQETVQGVKAAASAFFHTDCAGSIGDIFAVAHAEATDGAEHTVVVRDEPLQGAWIDSSVTASANGSTNCYSWAQSSVTMGGNVVYQTGLKENYACPPVPVVASASGPASVTTDYYNNSGCANVTWTASATGGHPGYTYSWYIGTDPTEQGTGSTFTKSYCNTSQSVTVKVVASDSDGHTDDETYTTNVVHTPQLTASVNGPASVTTDHYINSGCTNVTWTASATGGHPGGYTYSWYIGTDPAVQGTGSTFTKSYCNTSQSVPVKVVASDSDGHTDDETYTTNVVHTPQLTASVSGPTSVTTDYYINSGCANVTWTASATDGHPGGYTYSWYIGTDPTVQGTGSTFTKSYCNTTSQSVTVKVVASDSDGHTDDETYTTIIVPEPQVIASVSGPASVTTDYYINSGCANVTWTASATGGHPGYTYSWYLGTSTATTVQGTGPTFTKSLCTTDQSVTVKVVDSDGHTANKTFTTSVQHTPQLTASVSGPASVTTDYYGPTCVDATWTASATGGHPGYTYSWYLGTSTGTTVQGTGPTFTKNLCTTDQSVTVKVVDSDGHTGNKTFTTSVQHRPKIAARITGPDSVSSSTSCTTVSWTAGVTSTGHPGLSYKWYIGTVQQATGTTFSKQFCSSGGASQSVTVKATATASDGHQDTDPHTTTITFGPPPPPPLTATINGPAAVFSSSKCGTITWTANVSGGTPPYSYSWTLGASTTVLSTTSSLTRTYCSPQDIDVQLTVRDSSSPSQTATSTFNTVFENGM